MAVAVASCFPAQGFSPLLLERSSPVVPLLRRWQWRDAWKIPALRCARRTGDRRYPSEKKKRLRQMKSPLPGTDAGDREKGFCRLSNLRIPVGADPGKDFLGFSPPLLAAIAEVLEFPVADMIPLKALSIVRKAFDARKILKEPEFVYTVDIDIKLILELEPRMFEFISHLEPKLGIVEYMPKKDCFDLINIIHDLKLPQERKNFEDYGNTMEDRIDMKIKDYCLSSNCKKPRVAVVGSGPSGIFACLVLGELGADVTMIERGQAVEQRGRDIGALVARRILNPESNFCFGEGGAGTWSDGKLVTRIGRNSSSVQSIMGSLVRFGAPPNILIDGKPHLGTDRLVPLLRSFRQHLQGLGVSIKFSTRLDDLIVENGQTKGIKVSDVSHDPGANNQKLFYDAVILASGHSARDVYQILFNYGADLVPKDFAVGLRVEHPQELINSIQYSMLASEVREGRGKVPVADYKLKHFNGEDKGATTFSDDVSRCCYSFCMCPGGQIVLTSTNPSELCINGMSFSRRASKWANAALVVNVSSDDFHALSCCGPLAGIKFQTDLERQAAIMGGGNFTVPAQTVTDFLDNKLSVTSLPSSSYRLGVRASKLHELLPIRITQALRNSILMFDKELPGFISKDALLHGVETRTSAPIRIERREDTYECPSLRRLYPVGEGAGYAGGIVSAAVDGMHCGFAVAKNLGLHQGDLESILGKPPASTIARY